MNKKLDELLKYSRKYVPFYSRIKGHESVHKAYEFMPVVSKEIMARKPETFISTQYEARSLENYLTSGSSGRPLTIYKSKRDVYKSSRQLWFWRKNEYGVSLHDKMCSLYIRSLARPLMPTTFVDGNILYLSAIKMDSNTIIEYLSAMKNFMPLWIYSNPSSLYLFVKYALDAGCYTMPNIKYIELSGELLYDNYRECFSKFFSNAKIANLYGVREINAIAFELSCGHLHVLDDNVYLEHYGDNILVTGLNNYAMPFIKYIVEDNVKIEDSSCANGGQIISILNSRETDFVLLENSKLASPTLFHVWIEKINTPLTKVIQYQVRQTDRNTLCFSIVLKRKTKENIILIKQELVNLYVQSIFNNLNLDIEIVDVIHIDKLTGKYKYFYNDIVSIAVRKE